MRSQSHARKPQTTSRQAKDLAHKLTLSGHLDAAAKVLDEHLQREANDPSLWMQHAQLSQKLERFEMAVASFRQCAQLLRKAGHFSRARAALVCAKMLCPVHEGVLADLEALAAEVLPPAPILVNPAAMAVESDDPRERLTRVARPRAQLALVMDADMPTDPYCPLFDWLTEEA